MKLCIMGNELGSKVENVMYVKNEYITMERYLNKLSMILIGGL